MQPIYLPQCEQHAIFAVVVVVAVLGMGIGGSDSGGSCVGGGYGVHIGGILKCEVVTG